MRKQEAEPKQALPMRKASAEGPHRESERKKFIIINDLELKG